MSKIKNKAKYKELGSLLVQYRKEAGILQQADFARLVNATQQTVSRWEQGVSRPRENQISLIARALRLMKAGKIDAHELLTAAGYSKKVVTTSFDLPFPLDALTWESFQRFCADFLKDCYRSDRGVVHLNGDRGHTQYGCDIEVVFPDKCYQVECKRVNKFSPSEMEKIIQKNTTNADKKILMLSCVASSNLRTAIKKYGPIWDILDKEDISSEIRRKLSADEQKKLVDKYFRGQRLALLGEFEAGPWQTPEEFFKPFTDKYTSFSHKWVLVGRSNEVREVFSALSDTNKKLVFIVGTGGVGKSRFLKAVIEESYNIMPEVKFIFLNTTESINTKNLEDLGSNRKIIVVDDAHDVSSENIQRLLQYAIDHSNNTTLIFALRNYGIDRIKHQAYLEKEYFSEIFLKSLNISQATELATQVLTVFNGPIDQAENIARYTKDCSLATVVGAKIVAQEKIAIDFTGNQEYFSNIFKEKFKKIIIGDIGRKGDEDKIKKILRCIALIQPFYEYDKSIAGLIEQIEGIPTHEVSRLITVLINGGILLKRGEVYRITPDMLADFIIDETCRVEYNGASTGYAEKILDKSGDLYLKNILVNLAKLDWRLSDAEPSKSKLLDGVWSKLTSVNHIEIVTAVAYYQPKRALKFAEDLMRDGNHHSNLCELLKYAAYNLKHLPRACLLLWEINKCEKTVIQYNSGYAIRVLTELCEVKPNKIREYSEEVTNFCLELIKKEDSWNYLYTPFDILKGLMKTDGNIYDRKGLVVTISSFSINHEFIVGLRKKVIDAVFTLLMHKNKRIAVLAARFLETSIRYQHRISDIETDKWTKDFSQTLKKIEEVILTNKLDNLVLIQLADSVSWHAYYGKHETSIIAKRIIQSLPDSLDFRLTSGLIHGHPYDKDIVTDYELQEIINNKLLETLIKDIILEYPSSEAIYKIIENIIFDIKNNFSGGNSSPYVVVNNLIKSNLDFANQILANALKNDESKTINFVGVALTELFKKDYDQGIKIAYQFFDSGDEILQASVGQGYEGLFLLKENPMKYDIELLKNILLSNKEKVILTGINAVSSLSLSNKKLALSLIKLANIGVSKNVADQALHIFYKDISFDSLLSEDIFHFMKQLIEITELDGYWLEMFLANASKYYAEITANFFMSRVEYGAEKQDWGYRPCNYGPYAKVPLRFRESNEFRLLFKTISEWWLKSAKGDDYFFHKNAGYLFDVMFGPFDDEVVNFLLEWTEVATEHDFFIISRILNEAQYDFVFKYKTFVIGYLEKIKQCNDENYYHNAISALFGSTIKGVKSGSPGQPFPRDIMFKEESEKILNEIPRYSSAYVFYEKLKEYAEQNIKISNKDREYFLDE